MATAGEGREAVGTVALEAPEDVLRNFRWHRFGPYDPTYVLEERRLAHAFWGPTAPVTVAMTADVHKTTIEVRAFGPDAEWAVQQAPNWLSLDDDEGDFAPDHPLLRRLRRDLGRLRLVRPPSVFDMFVRLVFQQRVAWRDAARSFRQLTLTYGRPAPGPFSLTTALSAAQWRQIPPAELTARGVEAKRARTVRQAAVSARRIEETRSMTPEAANARLRAFSGVGVWTAQGVLGFGLGYPDAVQEEDYDLPRLVSVALSGEPRGDDARMLSLLAPYAGHRFRVIRLLLESNIKPPRFGPRRARPQWERG